MNEVMESGKCVVCATVGLVVAAGVAVTALAVVLNAVKVLFLT